MVEKLNNERIAHNFFFLLSTLILPFVGWAFNDFRLVFIGVSISVILKLIISCDIRLLMVDLILPFITFRKEFTFDNFPTTLILLAAIIFMVLLIFPLKYSVIHGKPKIKTGVLTRSFFVIGLVMFISPIVRNVLYNVPAFSDFPDGYNIMFGYVGGVCCLLLPLILILISTYKTDDPSPINNLMYLLGLFLLGELLFVMFYEKLPLDEALSSSGMGWSNKNSYMIIFELTFPFMAYTFSKNWKRIDALVIFLISIIIGLSSDSRAGQITLLACIPFLIWLLVPKVKYYKTTVLTTFIVIGSILVAGLFYIPDFQESIKRLYDSIFHDDNFSTIVTGRDIFWKWIYSYVFENPKQMLFGGSFSYLFEMFQAFNNTKEVNLWLAHNTFMTFLAAGGVLGLLAICYHYLDILISVFKNKNVNFLLIFTFVLLGFIHGLGDNTLFYINFMIPYFFVFQDIDRIKKVR